MSLLTRLRGSNVVSSPFPHIVLENALDEPTRVELHDSLPALEVFTQGQPPGSNKRFTLSHEDLVNSTQVGSTWKRVLNDSVTQGFLDCVLSLFADHLTREFPQFAERFAPLGQLCAMPRRKGQSLQKGQIALDAQIAVNSPALTSGTSVRTAHLDWTAKLFVGLLYLRPAHDHSRGADLELYRPRGQRLSYDLHRSLPASQVRLAKRVPYRDNTLVLFLNTPCSLHGVSPREATPHPRYFLNFVGEVHEPLWVVPATRQEGEDVPAQLSLGARLLEALFGRSAPAGGKAA